MTGIDQMSTEGLKDVRHGLDLLRTPFPPNQISQRKVTRDGPMLSYVGHAALTDRLLDVDPTWNWEPLTISNEGLPVMDPYGGMWIRLTVCGVTRLGYGHAGEKQGGDAIKEVIGDALRNAAMRFGAALELWHKGDLHAHIEDEVRGFDWSVFNPQEAKRVREVAQACIQYFNEGKEWGAYEEYSMLLARAKSSEFRNNVILALWEIFKPHSALRAYLKDAEQKERDAEVKQPA